VEPTATTTSGPIVGRIRDGVLSFAAVPFASPPVGDRRWLPAQPPEAWTETRDATRFGKVAVQTGGALEALGAGGPPDYDEDCLFLNVQTPALDAAARPVMVWIHGGSFANGGGSIPWYNGARLVERGDVVVVTINYRLGILGWFALDHLVATADWDPPGDEFGAANLGLSDQLAALRWVRDNIASFGGDPTNVTLFGESAGAMSVATLMATPAAKGLFHKVILQSGAGANALSLETAHSVADAVLAEFDGNLERLVAASPEELLRVQDRISELAMRGRLEGIEWSPGQLPFGPVIDGALLPQLPAEAIAAGAAAHLPTLTGTNVDEWALFTVATKPPASEEDLLRGIGRVAADPQAVLDSYRQEHPEANLKALRDLVFTDWVFRLPALQLADAQLAAGQERTFVYRFDVASSAFGGALGSCHALEIPFVFNLLDGPGVELFTGPDAPQSVADDMTAAWLEFAATGDPATSDRPWPRYNTQTRPTRIFAVEAAVLEDPGAVTRRAWPASLASQ
jgi:para-nitrobenzyl esterase